MREYRDFHAHAPGVSPHERKALQDQRDEEVDPMMTFNLIPAASVKPFGHQHDATRVWAGVRLVDGATTAMGHSAWSPPI